MQGDLQTDAASGYANSDAEPDPQPESGMNEDAEETYDEGQEYPWTEADSWNTTEAAQGEEDYWNEAAEGWSEHDWSAQDVSWANSAEWYDDYDQSWSEDVWSTQDWTSSSWDERHLNVLERESDFEVESNVVALNTFDTQFEQAMCYLYFC